ncbi:putative ribonuclease H-like domain-containing protein [Tanacetum coccineum]
MVSRNNYNRVDYDYYAKTAHPSAHRNMTPRAVLLKTGLTPLNTVRLVNTAHPKPTVHSAKSMSHFSKQTQSTYQRPFYKKTELTSRYVNQKLNIAMRHYHTERPRVVNTARSYTTPVNVVREKRGKPQQDDTGFINSGCSRHMIGNIAYLSDFKEFDGGYVTFGGGAHGGRISGKGTLKIDSLDFEDVYFLPDESQILLKIPRKDNMYSFDMKNIVPKESLTCLVAKATSDESMLWHRRLGHINFKNINKLVKDNLVRGLPTKCFENDQTCVACLKGKQHRASCKSKVLNPITKPLFMLHMDLFGPTFVSSLMHKKYCLVVTDDYSRFTWVFFLTTKDETSEILKNFIKEIENLVDKKVKIIRSDNGTEFKNKVMDDFCREKGIKREYSIARTPQQNGVAERRNKTLIEAAKTMLADSKLPTTFWAEAVSTACYVQNRVLVVKPHNKTPYELFKGFKPTLSFMRPFGCYDTILNTLENLGKFDGKSDESFFVGYSLSSKAFRVYNTRTRRVEENLHIEFLENKPMIEGNGPKWLFDIDCLTQSMNYVPVAAGTISNESTGTQGELNADTSTPVDLKKFNYTDVKSASTPVDLEKPLVKDGDADDVDVHLYRSMIGSLMYLTSSRPDIMDSPFELVAYTDSDYAGATQDRKSTTRGCQFLGNKLISWQCKNQTVVATSITEAKYVAAASCCRQVLWIQNQLLDYRHVQRGRDTKIPQFSGPPVKVGDEAVHKELGDRMERAATTASILEAEQDNENKLRDDKNFRERLERETREKISLHHYDQENKLRDDKNFKERLVPSCFAIFDLEPLSSSFDFVFVFEIFKSLSFRLDHLCHLAILCLDQHAHTLHHLESLLTISLDRLDILKEDLEYQTCGNESDSAGMRHLHLHLYMNPEIKQSAIKRVDEYGFVIRPDLVGLTFGSVRTNL